MRNHEIPFSSEDLATIGQTAMWMRIAGGIILALGLVALYSQREVWTVVSLLPWITVLMAAIISFAPIVVGGLILVAASGFSETAIRPSVTPLARGLRALMILYVLQAITLIAMLMLFLWIFVVR